MTNTVKTAKTRDDLAHARYNLYKVLSRKPFDLIRAADYRPAFRTRDAYIEYAGRAQGQTHLHWVLDVNGDPITPAQGEYAVVFPYACNRGKEFERAAGYICGKKCVRVKSELDWYPSFGCVSVEYGDTFHVSSCEGWGDRYSSRCTYRKVYHNLTVNIPKSGILAVMDGILTYSKHAPHTVPGTPLHVLRGESYGKGRGYSVNNLGLLYVVYDGEDVYHYGRAAHGQTVEEALKAYRRKLNAEARKARGPQPINPDKPISAATYRRWTGACEPGTRAFCEREGLDYATSRVTPRELLDILQPHDYGRERIAAIVRAWDTAHAEPATV